jgi:hypothetical protein
MKENKTLIMLDIEGNNKMYIEDVKSIQDIIVKNKQVKNFIIIGI